MANRYLIDINQNDALPDVIRKTNHNFRTISGSQTKLTQGSIRTKATELWNRCRSWFGHSLGLLRSSESVTVKLLDDEGNAVGDAATIPSATTSLAGVLTAADKSRLDNIPLGYNGDNWISVAISNDILNVEHENPQITPGSAGPSSNVNPGFGGTFDVPNITYDARGHIIATSTKSVTLPTIQASDVPDLSSSYDERYYRLSGLTPLQQGDDLDTLITEGTYYATIPTSITLSNAPVSNVAFKLIVERVQSNANYLRQRLSEYNGYLEWSRYTTNGGTTWQTWMREAPKSSPNATANRFLATPSGATGLPSYRAIDLADIQAALAPQTYDVTSLVTAGTAAFSPTISNATLYRSGYNAQLVIEYTNGAAATADTEYNLCQLAAAIKPVGRCVGSSANGFLAFNDSTRRAYIYYKKDYPASTSTKRIVLHYILANMYTG